MNPSAYRLDVERSSTRHGWILTLAMIVSAASHILLWNQFGDKLLSPAQALQSQQVRRLTREQRDRIQVERLTPEPEPAPEADAPLLGEWAESALALATADALPSPDPVLLTPPAITEDLFVGDVGPDLHEPDTLPDSPPWEPRQIIQEIVSRRVPDALALLPRREIPHIERVSRAPDYVAPFDLQAQRFVPVTLTPEQPAAREPTDAPTAPPGFEEMDPLARLPQGDDRSVADRIEPVVESHPAIPEVDVYEAVEEYLVARVMTFRERPDADHVYFRIDIDRRDEDILPAIPKDIVLMQDVSASISEQRLFFCRQALVDALDWLNPEDRFNVMAFSDSTRLSFDDWQSATQANKQQARTFINRLRVGGSADLLSALRRVLEMPHEIGRPIIVILITDGFPAVGVTASTDIIGEFSRLNDGRVSVYTVGTQQTANLYLLDLLSYSNRGNATLVRGGMVLDGRWALPQHVGMMMQRTRRPLLDNLRVRFDAASRAEVYPEISANLYADQPLVFHGRLPAETTQLVFQARGSSPDLQADMLFVIDLDAVADVRDATIRQQWAQQKLYGLIYRYIRTRDRSLLREMRALRRPYRIDIPFTDEF